MFWQEKKSADLYDHEVTRLFLHRGNIFSASTSVQPVAETFAKRGNRFARRPVQEDFLVSEYCGTQLSRTFDLRMERNFQKEQSWKSSSYRRGHMLFDAPIGKHVSDRREIREGDFDASFG